MADSDPTALEDMNPKQRLKEFKLVGKDVKSKDMVVKLASIEKVFKDTRYLLDGALFCPFFDSITSKKVRLIYNNLCCYY
jgi:hypothetical protein